MALSDVDRARAAWWTLGFALAGALLFVTYSFVGTFVFGVFIYYGTRPIYEQLEDRLRYPSVAAAVSLLLLALPFLLLLAYTLSVGIQEFQRVSDEVSLPALEGVVEPYVDVASIVQNPQSLLEEPDVVAAVGEFLSQAGSVGGFLASALLHLFVMIQNVSDHPVERPLLRVMPTAGLAKDDHPFGREHPYNAMVIGRPAEGRMFITWALQAHLEYAARLHPPLPPGGILPVVLPQETVDRLKLPLVLRPALAGLIIGVGCAVFAFFVVLSGRVEIIETSHGETRRVTVHEPGEFTGDVDLLTGRASLVAARVIEAGEVLEIDARALQRVVGELPEISETLLKAFLTRRTLLLEEGYAGIRIIGSRFSPEAHELREFASRNAIPFTWVDLEKDAQAEHLLRQFGVTADATPIVIGRDGRWVSNPPVHGLARYAGLDREVEPGEVYDLVVVGAGPAGLAASVYAASEGLRVLTLEGVAAGGQAGTSSRIENYLGFPTGISGAELARNALLQAQKFGVRISVPRRATALRCDGGVHVLRLDEGTEIRGRTVLVASGVEYRSLDVPGLERFEGAGVYYAASDVEARLCRDEEVAIVGGGNSAGQAAMHLARTASHVHIVLRSGDLGKSMSRYLVDRIGGTPNITVHRRQQVSGAEGDGALTGLRVRHNQTGEAAWRWTKRGSS